MAPKTKQKTSWWVVFLSLLLFPLVIIYAVVFLFAKLLAIIVLHLLVWSLWCTRKKNVLFVYSDSPISYEYMHQSVIPNLPPGSTLLNWSERKKWKSSLASEVFKHIAGDEEYCPIGLVFRPFRKTLKFRYYKAFQQFKHGDPSAVIAITANFLGSIK